MDNLKVNYDQEMGSDRDIFYCKVLLAGKKIEIESRSKRTLAFFREYLSQFEKPDFVIQAAQKDIQEEIVHNYYEYVKTAEQQDNVAVEAINAETSVIYRMIADKMLEYCIIMMHGAAISVNDKCYIFSAASGTGKTTHINNWIKAIPGTIVVNGDKPLIDVEKKLVYGTPWRGKEEMGINTVVPLGGLIWLERGKTNEIAPISFREMLPCLLQQVYIPITDKERISAYQHIGELKGIPCYKLKCNMDEEAALVAYNGIKGYEQENGR